MSVAVEHLWKTEYVVRQQLECCLVWQMLTLLNSAGSKVK